MDRITSRHVDCPTCGAKAGVQCVGSSYGRSRGAFVDYHPNRRIKASVHRIDGLRRFAQGAIDYRLKYHAPAAIVAIEERDEGVRIVLNSGGNFLEIQGRLDDLGVPYEDDGLALLIRYPHELVK